MSQHKTLPKTKVIYNILRLSRLHFRRFYNRTDAFSFLHHWLLMRRAHCGLLHFFLFHFLLFLHLLFLLHLRLLNFLTFFLFNLYLLYYLLINLWFIFSFSLTFFFHHLFLSWFLYSFLLLSFRFFSFSLTGANLKDPVAPIPFTCIKLPSSTPDFSVFFIK